MPPEETIVPEAKSYPPETVLTKAQLAKALNCSRDLIESSDVPVTYALGSQTPGYIWGDVVAHLRKYTRH